VSIALRYEDLYSSVPYDHSVLHDISDEVENGINSSITATSLWYYNAHGSVTKVDVITANITTKK